MFESLTENDATLLPETQSPLDRIAEKGARLSAKKLDPKDQKTGIYISYVEDYSGAWSWSVTGMWYAIVSKLTRNPTNPDMPSPVILLLMPGYIITLTIDAAQFVLRLLLFPIIFGAWWLEHALGRLRNRYILCSICHNTMPSAMVYCPKCDRVQGIIRPRVTGLFFNRCQGCGNAHWHTLGQRWFLPRPLVCRDTPLLSGCYHAHEVAALAKLQPFTAVAILGVTVRAKHSLIGFLFRHLVTSTNRKKLKTIWNLNDDELQLCEERLWNAFWSSTQDCEQPDKDYSLAQTFLLSDESKLHLFHNFAHAATKSKNRMIKNVLNLWPVRKIIFVVDFESLDRKKMENMTPAVEILSRFVHAAEEYLSLSPGSPLPFQMAVVLPYPQRRKMPAFVDYDGSIAAESLAGVLREKTPALYAALGRMFSRKKIRFFGGIIPKTNDMFSTSWVKSLAKWTQQK